MATGPWYPPAGCKRMSDAPYSIHWESDADNPLPCDAAQAAPALTYPLAAPAMLTETDAVSPILEGATLVKHDLLTADKVAPPTHADDANPSLFWEEFVDVLYFAELAHAGTLATKKA